MAVMVVVTISKFIAHMGQVLFKFNLTYAMVLIIVLHSMLMSRFMIALMPTFKRL